MFSSKNTVVSGEEFIDDTASTNYMQILNQIYKKI